ncbi:MAG: DUF2796 domain-containing protein [Bdellovibrionaceae bacterium]|nr:DUF2796 domain-containing protein [Bdellovibrio sp.]
MKIIITLILVFTRQSMAQHREHTAHKHGSAEMAIAFQEKSGEIDIEVPSESIFGFEYEAKKDSDKKRQQAALDNLEKNISKMVQFNAALKCVISKDVIEVKQIKGKNHSSVHAVFKVACEKSPLGTQLGLNIQENFPKIKDIDLALIIDDLQKSVQVTQSTKIELKK